MVPSDTEEEDPYSQNPEQQRQSQSDERSRNRQPRFKRGFRVSHMWITTPLNRDEDSDTDDEYLGHMVKRDTDTQSEELSSVTGYHVVRIVLRLLRSLGELDMGPHGYLRGRALSATILPHLLYLFSQFRQLGLKAAELNSIAKTELWLDNHHYQNNKQNSSKSNENQHPDQPCSSVTQSGNKKVTHNVDGQYKGNGPAEAEAGPIGQKSDEFDIYETQTEEEFESVPWHGTCKMLVLRQLVRAILTLSGIVATQQNGIRILINLKVVDTLLDL